ncbi:MULTISPECIES: hypothetical protein [Sorangium]|uniref:hypothetical protein n=1 Tax=Sorangium TaxID=39643 RepID=UPI003D9C131B
MSPVLFGSQALSCLSSWGGGASGGSELDSCGSVTRHLGHNGSNSEHRLPHAGHWMDDEAITSA